MAGLYEKENAGLSDKLQQIEQPPSRDRDKPALSAAAITSVENLRVTAGNMAARNLSFQERVLDARERRRDELWSPLKGLAPKDREAAAQAKYDKALEDCLLSMGLVYRSKHLDPEIITGAP
jgi:hypothetical protein